MTALSPTVKSAFASADAELRQGMKARTAALAFADKLRRLADQIDGQGLRVVSEDLDIISIDGVLALSGFAVLRRRA